MAEIIDKPEGSSDVLTPKKSRAAGQKGFILLVVGIIILLAIVVFLVFTIFSSPFGKSGWHAVFLTNGQTYFGHIVKQNSNTVVLRNVYYIQVQQPEGAEEGEEPQPQLSLVSISDEFHGPEDEVQINWNHVLFVERLSKDSQVVTTLEQQVEE